MNTINQIKNSFDPITLKRIGKGALHTFVVSALVAGALATLSFLGQQDYGNPLLTFLMVQLSGTLYNAIKEYKKGE